jgi:NADH:ubiquinone oxidoreductase subunit E
MADTKELINALSTKHGVERRSLLPILQGIVEKENYLSKESMLEVAKVLDISAAEVYGTASFFSFLDTKERGQYVIRVCKSMTCDMKGKEEILSTIESVLKIKLGETTQDKKFSFLETNCLGLCEEGPAMLINDDYFVKLTPAKIREILDRYLRNEI